MAVVYRHIRHDKNEPFYIGASTNRSRPFAKDGRNPKWNEIVALTDYTVQILFEDIDLEFAKEKEREFIAMYGRMMDGGILTNVHFGGDGIRLGVKCSDEYKKIMSARVKGENNPMFGKKRPEALKQKLSKLWEGENSLQSKLTNSDVVKIRELYSEGVIYIKLAKMFNVSLTCIGDIIRGKTWTHI